MQGRIHQIEYAMEAVKQGSATVGLKSKTHAVLVALKVSKIIISQQSVILAQNYHRCYYFVQQWKDLVTVIMSRDNERCFREAAITENTGKQFHLISTAEIN